MNILNSWTEAAGRVSPEEMNESRNKYLEERGLDRLSVDYFKPNHPAMGDIFGARNWVRLLPDDTVIRLRNTDDVYSELSEIVAETYETMEASTSGNLRSPEETRASLPENLEDVEYKEGHRAYLCEIITEILLGDTDVAKVRKGLTSVPSEPRQQPPEHAITVLVEFRNECNMLDLAFFEIEDPAALFGRRFGSSILMFEAMAHHEVEAETVVNNVAFETEGTGWAKSEPPEHSIAFQSTDQRNRSGLFRINNPKEYYGSAWGNINEMIEIGNSDEGIERREFLYDTGPIGWRISLAI